ncbi:LOW QUALITY PROTEIN: inositol 1,4,5-trisphosphate receptor-interacting protein-like 2 [Phaenicophaeus curvirostris]|uniref:LOW QUALITY PROTEIN: inositol 1,4,5-trisphosphate receptor-interacting protein-like 2 n=1 Tax=Phaenicophaeus curvirostris TaxID=33595 RepID=UPI0037F0AD4F
MEPDGLLRPGCPRRGAEGPGPPALPAPPGAAEPPPPAALPPRALSGLSQGSPGAPRGPRPGRSPPPGRHFLRAAGRAAALAGAGAAGGRRGAGPAWPVLAGLCAALLCLCQALRGAEGAAEAGSALLLLLGCLLGCRRAAEPGEAALLGARGRGGGEAAALRGALERFHARELRGSPHALGHSRAHAARAVSELVRAAKAQGLRPGPLALSLRGDFVPVGSAYEQHLVRRPARFDVLVPLRLPPPLEPRGTQEEEEEEEGGGGGGGAFACALRARRGAPEPRGRLSSALVLRWFRAHLRRCLGAARGRLRDGCRLSLWAPPGRPPTLLVAPRPDSACCRGAVAVRLVPAVPLGRALYLTAPPPPAPRRGADDALWGLDASRQEQRLLGWVRERGPASACHLKCLRILKGLRDLRRRGLREPLGSRWGRVLSSYVLKTAVLSLLLRGPLERWDERFLVERLEELVLFLRDCLRRRALMHLFLGNAGLPEALAVPRFLREAAPVNLLAAFDAATLDAVALQLVDTWARAPRLIAAYGGPRACCPAALPGQLCGKAQRLTPRETADRPMAPRGLGPTAPQDLSPTAPRSLGPTAPRGLGPTAPRDLGPTAPRDLGPTAPRGLGPTAPQDLSPTAPRGLGPTAPQDLSPTAPRSLGPTAPRGLGPTAPRGLSTTAPRGLGPTARNRPSAAPGRREPLKCASMARPSLEKAPKPQPKTS